MALTSLDCCIDLRICKLSYLENSISGVLHSINGLHKWTHEVTKSRAWLRKWTSLQSVCKVQSLGIKWAPNIQWLLLWLFLKKIFFKVWLGPICFYLFLKFYFGCAGSLLWHTGFASWVPGLSCPEVCGILVPWSGIEPMSPAMEGGFLTPGPPRKSPATMMSKLRKKMTTGTFPCSIGETEVGEDLEHLGRSSQGTQWEGHELWEEGSRLPLCRVYLRVDPVSHGKELKSLGNWERSCW